MVTIQIGTKSKDSKVQVTFTMPANEGYSCLYLVGDFSGWNESVYRMQRTDEGRWSLTLELQPGREYQYRFRTNDGVWIHDPVTPYILNLSKGSTLAVSSKEVKMQITRQADYAVRAVLQLSRTGNSQRISTGFIAREQNIPPAFLPKIISQLSKAGILNTSRGSRGGIRLAREPKNITLLEVVEAIEGAVQFNECARGEGVCVLENNCPIRSVWCEVQKEFTAKLRNVDFAQFNNGVLVRDQNEHCPC